MEFDMLMKLLDEKLISLKQKKDIYDKSNAELANVQKIIDKIVMEPYCLYENGNEDLLRYLGFSSEELKEIEICKNIYRGYLRWGDKKFPQIGRVHDTTKALEDVLKQKMGMLNDIICQNQLELLKIEDYEILRKEIIGSDCYITNLDSLFDLLKKSDLDVNEANKIRRAVLTRNNSIYYKKKKALDESLKSTKNEPVIEILGQGTEGKTDYEKEIDDIQNQLITSLGEETYKNLKDWFDALIRECDDMELLSDHFKSFSYDARVGNLKAIELFDAILLLEKIEMLEWKDACSDDKNANNELSDYLRKIEARVSFIEDLKNVTLDNTSASKVEVDISDDSELGLSGVEKAVQEFDADPLATPNCVLFLNNSVAKEVYTKDSDVNSSIFCLIEKIRKVGFNNNDSLGYIGAKSKKLTGFKSKLMELQPHNSTDEARVYCVHAGGNRYVIIGAVAKKSDWPKGLDGTLKDRESQVRRFLKNLDRDENFLAKKLEDSEKTMSNLKDMVSGNNPSKRGGK